MRTYKAIESLKGSVGSGDGREKVEEGHETVDRGAEVASGGV